jgi:hypothetical protein
MISKTTYEYIESQITDVIYDNLRSEDIILTAYNQMELASYIIETDVLPSNFALNTYNSLVDENTSYSDNLGIAIRALQNHILRYFDSVNAFYEAYGIYVSTYFAEASEAVGFAIDETWIE